MNKNGFTLIELMVTIAIMLLLITIAVPSMLGAYEKKKIDQCESYVEQFKTLAELYVSDHKNEIAEKQTNYITLSTLEDEDYLNDIPINPLTDRKFEGEIKITRSGTNPNYIFNYEYSVKCE